MALVQCPNCGKNISDKAEECPSCGVTFPARGLICPDCGKELTEGTEICPNCGCPNNINKKKTKRKKWPFFLCIVLLLIGLYVYKDNTDVNTYNDFAALYNTMAEGAAEAESANNLILNVWRNSIYQRTDAETDSFTRQNSGTGAFYSDFNDALLYLFSDEEFSGRLNKIRNCQIDAETLIKKLNKHPKAFDGEYTAFRECYLNFMEFTDLSLYAKGSCQSFSDDFDKLDRQISQELRELKLYFDRE